MCQPARGYENQSTGITKVWARRSHWVASASCNEFPCGVGYRADTSLHAETRLARLAFGSIQTLLREAGSRYDCGAWLSWNILEQIPWRKVCYFGRAATKIEYAWHGLLGLTWFQQGGKCLTTLMLRGPNATTSVIYILQCSAGNVGRVPTQV